MNSRVCLLLFITLSSVAYTKAWFLIWLCRYQSWSTNYYGMVTANEFAITDPENEMIMLSSDDSCLTQAGLAPSVSAYLEDGLIIRMRRDRTEKCFFLGNELVKNICHGNCYTYAKRRVDQLAKGNKEHMVTERKSKGQFKQSCTTRSSENSILCTDLTTYELEIAGTGSGSSNSNFTGVSTLFGKFDIAGQRCQ